MATDRDLQLSWYKIEHKTMLRRNLWLIEGILLSMFLVWVMVAF